MGYFDNTRSLARTLTEKHGDLVEVRCISGPRPCHIELIFADEYKLNVGDHSGNLDINILNFGYYGTGPRMFHSFLDEAGFQISYEQVAEMKAGSILRKSKE
jgi:hypothetical protein